LIRKVLTKYVIEEEQAKGRKVKVKQVPPSERMVLITAFAIAVIAALTLLEVVHLMVLGTWNTEVFAAITGLVGTVVGIVIRSKG